MRLSWNEVRIRAARFADEWSDIRIGFVATNSITQGEQVAQLWPILFTRDNLEIFFAHRTFAWGSDALGKAHVHVVIIGLDSQENVRADKRLFSYLDIKGEPEETLHVALSPYMFDAGGLADPHLTVREESRPINRMGKLIIGSNPIDGGHYVFTADERSALLAMEPCAEPFLRPFIGAREYLQGSDRWILAPHEAPPATLSRLSRVKERIAAVRKYREGRESKPTQELAKTPTLYHVNILPVAPFLVIPEVSSERREYAKRGAAVRSVQDASVEDRQSQSVTFTTQMVSLWGRGGPQHLVVLRLLHSSYPFRVRGVS